RTRSDFSSVVKPTQIQWERSPMSPPPARGLGTGMACAFSASFWRRGSAVACARAFFLAWREGGLAGAGADDEALCGTTMATPARRRKRRREEGETATADSLINGINRGFK